MGAIPEVESSVPERPLLLPRQRTGQLSTGGSLCLAWAADDFLPLVLAGINEQTPLFCGKGCLVFIPLQVASFVAINHGQ